MRRVEDRESRGWNLWPNWVRMRNILKRRQHSCYRLFDCQRGQVATPQFRVNLTTSPTNITHPLNGQAHTEARLPRRRILQPKLSTGFQMNRVLRG
jgi:hypothetical protein